MSRTKFLAVMAGVAAFLPICAVADGPVIGWGNTSVPAGLSNVISITAGVGRAAAVLADGSLVEWPPTSPPKGLGGLVTLAEGYYHVLALKRDGTVVAWGLNDHGQCNVPAGLSNVVGISAGLYDSVALKADGTVVAWGAITVPAGLSNVIAISAGAYHCLALRSNGTVVGFGLNQYGQCDIPPGLSDVIAISAGYAHNLALRGDGTIAQWGAAGDFTNGGKLPGDLSGVVAIVAGGFTSLALKADGTVVSSKLEPPQGLSGVTAIANGGSMCLAGKLPPFTMNQSYQVNADGAYFATTPGVLRGLSTVADAVLVSHPGHGLLNLFADGAFSYIPDPGFYGQDAFSFKASNIYGTSNTSVVTLVVSLNLRALILSPSSVVGGNPSAGTVLVGPSGGVSLALKSDNSNAIAPAYVSVAPGSLLANFRVQTLPVDAEQVAHITAALGPKTVQGTLTIVPPALQKVLFGPAQVVAGNSVKVYVYLDGKAGPSGVTVHCTSSFMFLNGATVMVPFGQSVAAFSYTPPGFGYSVNIPVTATYAGVSKSASLVDSPATIVKVVLSPTAVIGGAPAICTATLNGDPGLWGALTQVKASDPVVTTPLTANFGSRARTVSFTVQTAKVAAQKVVTITVDGGTRGKVSTLLTVNP